MVNVSPALWKPSIIVRLLLAGVDDTWWLVVSCRWELTDLNEEAGGRQGAAGELMGRSFFFFGVEGVRVLIRNLAFRKGGPLSLCCRMTRMRDPGDKREKYSFPSSRVVTSRGESGAFRLLPTRLHSAVTATEYKCQALPNTDYSLRACCPTRPPRRRLAQ